jgi:glycosyltransferase involved in cell wall biosynthesis
MTVFVSDAIGHERLPFVGVDPAPAGSSRRTWTVLSGLYQDALRASGEVVKSLIRPEIYQTEIARRTLGVAPGDWHLAIKPIEHLRPFHGLPNVFLCAWEFPELSSSDFGISPFLDQVAVLRNADAVACCTEFTAANLRRAGIETATVWPPVVPVRNTARPPAVRAIPLAAFADPSAGNGSPLAHSLVDLAARGRTTFVSVVEADHLPRQLGPLIEAFVAARAERGTIALIVALVGGDRDGCVRAPIDLAPNLGAASAGALSDILIVSDPLDAAGLAALIGSADIYLCCSAAEGLNLPVIEAMLAGVPVVTTMISAMGSYLTPDSAIRIATRPEIADPSDNVLAPHLCIAWQAPISSAIRDAVLAAATLDPAARARMVGAARAIAARVFGQDAFEAGLGRLRALVSWAGR